METANGTAERAAAAPALDVCVCVYVWKIAIARRALCTIVMAVVAVAGGWTERGLTGGHILNSARIQSKLKQNKRKLIAHIVLGLTF